MTETLTKTYFHYENTDAQVAEQLGYSSVEEYRDSRELDRLLAKAEAFDAWERTYKARQKADWR